MPTISVIIPIYNTEKYLRRCLDSVARQTYCDWEALCVNDGSTDGSREILREYAGRDPRFKVIDKPNGGQSDARNVGLDEATGEYINFIDSDDLIHPQTFEIALALARRDGSDIVTWYKDPLFRPSLFIRHALGLNIDNALPRGINRHFQLDRIGSLVTEDALAHAVQGKGQGIKYPIKRFYVWRFLLRRSLVQNVRFVKGIIFEEFPWWSEVLLRLPRTTITRLPFYYYFPNFNSTDLSSKRRYKMECWIKGIERIWPIYQRKATSGQLQRWEKQLLWPVINGQIVGKMVMLREEEGRGVIREGLQRLWQQGVFAAPPDRRSAKSQRFIARFIGEE